MHRGQHTSTRPSEGVRGERGTPRGATAYSSTRRSAATQNYDPPSVIRPSTGSSRLTVTAAPPSADVPPTSARLLRSLQEENDTLRSQLLRTERERDQLAQQLEAARVLAAAARATATAATTARSASLPLPPLPSSSGVEIDTQAATAKLRERCEQLADRLLATVRDQQVTHSAEVYFLLRTQQEERRFLCDGLEAMLTELQTESRSERKARRAEMYGTRVFADTGGEAGSEGGGDELTTGGGLHTGTVYRLVMMVADALQQRKVVAKLEKARACMALEQATSLLRELQEATGRVTKTIFTTSSSLIETFEDAEAEAEADVGNNAPGPSSASGFHNYNPALDSSHRPPRRGSRLTQGDARTHVSSSRWEHESLLTSRLSTTADGAVQDLEWSCDALKACFKGLAEAQRHVAAAAEVLSVSPSLSGGSSNGRGGPYHRLSNASRSSSRGQSRGGSDSEADATVAAVLTPLSLSPEMEGLLSGVLHDLQGMARRAARDRETVTRRLTEELRRHYDTAKQYEQRVRLLEAENSKLTATVAKTLYADGGGSTKALQSASGEHGGGVPVQHAGFAQTEVNPRPYANHTTPVSPQLSASVAALPAATARDTPVVEEGRRSVTPPERQGQRGRTSHRPLFRDDAHRAMGGRGRWEGSASTMPSTVGRLDLTSGDELSNTAPETSPIGSPDPAMAVAAGLSSYHKAIDDHHAMPHRRSPSLLSPAPRDLAAEGSDRRSRPMHHRDSRPHPDYRKRDQHHSRSPTAANTRRSLDGSSVASQKVTSPYMGEVAAGSGARPRSLSTASSSPPSTPFSTAGTSDADASPPPKPIRESALRRGVNRGDHQTLAGAALAERRQRRQSEQAARLQLVRGEVAKDEAAPSPQPVDTAAEAGKRARHMTSPAQERREPTVEYREGVVRRSAEAGAPWTEEDEVETAKDGNEESEAGEAVEAGQRTPDVWRTIRERASRSAALESLSAQR